MEIVKVSLGEKNNDNNEVVSFFEELSKIKFNPNISAEILTDVTNIWRFTKNPFVPQLMDLKNDENSLKLLYSIIVEAVSVATWAIILNDSFDWNSSIKTLPSYSNIVLVEFKKTVFINTKNNNVSGLQSISKIEQDIIKDREMVYLNH